LTYCFAGRVPHHSPGIPDRVLHLMSDTFFRSSDRVPHNNHRALRIAFGDALQIVHGLIKSLR
jgi:hypothetical protein